MKKLVILLYVCGLAVSIQPSRADLLNYSYENMFQDGRLWITIKYSDWCMPWDIKMVNKRVIGDTVFDGLECKKIEITCDGDTTYSCAREEGKKILIYSRDTQTRETGFHPIMDFSYNLGDTLPTGGIVKMVDYFIDGYALRKRMIIDQDGDMHIWIEGIGSPTDRDWLLSHPQRGLNTISYVIGCFQNSSRKITYDLFFMMPDDPYYDQYYVTTLGDDSSVEEIIEDKKERETDSDETLYDLHGLKIENPLPGSVYIQHGKKMVTPR